MGGLEPGNWVQVAPDVNPHRPDRRLIAQAEANRVTVIIEQTPEVNTVVHIAAVIEDHPTQPFLEGYRKASLGIKDEQLVTARGDANLFRTGRGIIFAAAEN